MTSLGYEILLKGWQLHYVSILQCQLKVRIFLERERQNDSAAWAMIGAVFRTNWGKSEQKSIREADWKEMRLKLHSIKSMCVSNFTSVFVNPFVPSPGHSMPHKFFSTRNTQGLAFVLAWQSAAPMYRSNWARLWESATVLTLKPGSGEKR